MVHVGFRMHKKLKNTKLKEQNKSIGCLDRTLVRTVDRKYLILER